MDSPSTQGKIEEVTISDVLELASWDRPRTDDELRSFRTRREAVIGVE